MNNRGFSTIELVIVIVFIGFLTLLTSKVTVRIKNKKLDFVVSEISYIIIKSEHSQVKSKFNQDTEWFIVDKEVDGESSSYYEIARYGKTDLFSKNDILYIFKKINNNETNDSKICLTNSGTIILKETVLDNDSKDDKNYGISIKKQ